MAGGSSRERDRTRERDRRNRDHRHSKDHHSRRSPEYYRNESSDDDMYDDTRRHRSSAPEYEGYDNDRRHYRRDRSRSRDRERDRDRHYDDYNEHNDQYDYGDDNYERERERVYYNRERREEVPNNTIMIRGLSSNICESDIVAILTENCLQAKDIRLMRKKETGASRGFAFVEFTNLNDAIRWKELTQVQGIVNFGDECQATVHFSIPKDAFGDKNIMKNDWCCYKCGVNNFKRREQCFKCGTPKEESIANDTGDEISLTPTNSLFLKNLSLHTTEERILTILGTFTALPIKSIKVLKDPTYGVSRGVCCVELHTTLEASQLFTLLSMNEGFIIDDSQVSVHYGKRNAQSSQVNANAVNAAIVALAAAQWTNQKESDTPSKANNKSHHVNYASSSTSVGNSNSNVGKLGTVNVNGVEYPKYADPIVSSFQYDESSGYYYDTSTGFYYDANSQYYYNSNTQKYMYWDANNHTYLPVDSDASSSASVSANSEVKNDDDKKEKTKDNKHDKVKIAKKIAKDMEKWAKTLNQKKETAKFGNIITEPIQSSSDITPSSSSTPQTLTADAGYSVFDMKSQDSELSIIEALQQQKKLMELNSPCISTDVIPSEDPLEIIKAEERRLTDYDKLACLLCKRQFSSRDQLTKHQQLSDLHKNNMMILKRSKLSDEQIEELERNEREGYRDRAKERRQKYGIPETPEPSKLKSKYLSEIEDQIVSTPKPQPTISKDNIGNKMLKAMGWTEGMGLGRANQGMSNIIEVERRTQGIGLGIRATTGSANESYKDAVKRAMQQRYKELSDRE